MNSLDSRVSLSTLMTIQAHVLTAGLLREGAVAFALCKFLREIHQRHHYRRLQQAENFVAWCDLRCNSVNPYVKDIRPGLAAKTGKINKLELTCKVQTKHKEEFNCVTLDPVAWLDNRCWNIAYWNIARYLHGLKIDRTVRRLRKHGLGSGRVELMTDGKELYVEGFM